MTKRFVLILKAENLSSIGELRLFPDMEICEHGGRFWIQGVYEKSLKLLLSSIPAEQRLWITQTDKLIPFGRKVPVMKLPIARWQSLKTFMEVELPVCAAPAEFSRTIPLLLKPDNVITNVNGLLCTLKSLSYFVESTSAIRLEPLSYALKPELAFIIGSPLPPLSGSRYFVTGKLALPLGYSFSYLNIATVKRIIGLTNTEHALFYKDSSWERIPDELIVPLTRSSFRCTREQTIDF